MDGGGRNASPGGGEEEVGGCWPGLVLVSAARGDAVALLPV